MYALYFCKRDLHFQSFDQERRIAACYHHFLVLFCCIHWPETRPNDPHCLHNWFTLTCLSELPNASLLGPYAAALFHHLFACWLSEKAPLHNFWTFLYVIHEPRKIGGPALQNMRKITYVVGRWPQPQPQLTHIHLTQRTLCQSENCLDFRGLMHAPHKVSTTANQMYWVGLKLEFLNNLI